LSSSEDEGISNGVPQFSSAISPGISAPVTIMQGCNNFCSYCIVPYVRGRERSRPSEEILKEIRFLVANGKREILLLGQNVNSYGTHSGESLTFVDLLRAIQEQIPLARLRFTTSHPKDLTDELMECFAQLDCLCQHLHLPVQAGSDRILAREPWLYSTRLPEKIERLRHLCPILAFHRILWWVSAKVSGFQDTRLLERAFGYGFLPSL
jgi:tRNA-2-methylthio-N6-dimethylallyladenosine synthase